MGNLDNSVHLIDGTGTHQSYAVVARRGNIFLGIKFSGLVDGDEIRPSRHELPARTPAQCPVEAEM